MANISVRFGGSNVCPACGTGTKGCSVTDDGLHLCRGKFASPPAGWREMTPGEDSEGFHHYRRDDGCDQVSRPRRTSVPPARTTWDTSAEECVEAWAGRKTGVVELAQHLGVTAASLAVLVVGVREDSNGIHTAWPERDASGATVGINRRYKDGSKRMIKGGSRGLYYSDDLRNQSGTLVIVEGGTDAAAALSAEIPAVGRSSCTSTKHLAELLRDWQGEIIIVGENDRNPETGEWPGRDGAEKSTQNLAREMGRPIRWAMTPDGCKDTREWMNHPDRAAIPWAERGKWYVEKLAATAETVAPSGNTAVATSTEFEPNLICLADVETTEVPWLWPRRIPIGRSTLLVGRPGDGKTFFTCWLAACVSRGTNFPDGMAGVIGDTIILNAEDDASDTLKPRLVGCGADCSRVHVLPTAKATDANGKKSERVITLADLPIIEAALKRLPETKLVIVDPIGSYLGGCVDAYRDNEVRSVLAPLNELASRYGFAVLFVAHPRKGAADFADDMVLGSRAFTGIVRSVWHLGRDPNNLERRLFLAGKYNLKGRPGHGLAFTIDGDPAAIQWEEGDAGITADELMSAQSRAAEDRRKPGPKADKRIAAANWLTQQLADGPKSPSDLMAAVEAAGHTWATVQRARTDLGIVAERNQFGGGTVWRLCPSQSSQDTICCDAEPPHIENNLRSSEDCEKQAENANSELESDIVLASSTQPETDAVPAPAEPPPPPKKRRRITATAGEKGGVS